MQISRIDHQSGSFYGTFTYPWTHHTRLNKFVLRPTHPTRTPRDVVAEIDSECRFYTSFDAANGYYQIPLHPSSQHLTTFMTPWGRYKFLRAYMGLSCSGDKYNRRADVAFAAVSNTVRVVDDLLRFDRTFPEHVRGVCEVLQAARDAGITFSKEKFRFALIVCRGLDTRSSTAELPSRRPN
jgi:hypothetical protein